jgi:glycosyltransferase involved in cell wall biosynthesis
VSRPFHLVVYSDALERGGAEVTLAMLLGALPEYVQVSIVAVDQQVADFLGGHRPDALVRTTAQITGRTDIAGFRRHRRIFRELAPDLIQFNLGIMSSSQWAMLTAASIPRQKMIAVENSSMVTWSPLSHRLKKVTSSRLAAHLAVGEHTARIIEEHAGLVPGSVEPMYHGVSNVRRDVLHEPGDGPVIVNVARHDPVKGVDLLLRAMALVDPSVRLVQIGRGEKTDELTALRDELGLTDRVELRDLPWGERAADHLAGFDLFVLASRTEGLPVTVMEAMLAGVAVVTTDVGSVREAVVDGETGLVVAPEDPAALAAAITTLIADPDLRSAMGERARVIAEDRFTIQATVDRYLALYDRVLEPRR